MQKFLIAFSGLELVSIVIFIMQVLHFDISIYLLILVALVSLLAVGLESLLLLDSFQRTKIEVTFHLSIRKVYDTRCDRIRHCFFGSILVLRMIISSLYLMNLVHIIESSSLNTFIIVSMIFILFVHIITISLVPKPISFTEFFSKEIGSYYVDPIFISS